MLGLVIASLLGVYSLVYFFSGEFAFESLSLKVFTGIFRRSFELTRNIDLARTHLGGVGQPGYTFETRRLGFSVLISGFRRVGRQYYTLCEASCSRPQ